MRSKILTSLSLCVGALSVFFEKVQAVLRFLVDVTGVLVNNVAQISWSVGISMDEKESSRVI